MHTEVAECRDEANTLVELLQARHASLSYTLDGAFPELRTTIWQSESSVQGAVQGLTPQMTENKKKVRVWVMGTGGSDGAVKQEALCSALHARQSRIKRQGAYFVPLS